MESRANVLVFSSSNYQGVQIIESLKHQPLFHVVAAASYPNHAEMICEDAVIGLPFISDPGFMPAFLKLLRERDIRYIIPTDESICLLLKEREAELNAAVVCSPLETAQMCRHKKLMFQAVSGQSYAPRVYSSDRLDDISEYPVFIKPDSSQGSRGARLISSREELDKAGPLEDMVICEYLPGEEYTVDCFTNRDRKLIFCNPRVRSRLMNGVTARGHDVPCDAEFLEVINGLNSVVHFRGYWFAQLKRDRNGKLKLLEICTRFAGSFAISKGKGVNLPLLALCDFSGRQADVIVNDYTVECDKTYVDRYRLDFSYDTVYVDYDDTVTMKEGRAVNPEVIAYLYQCRYKKKKIILITRHSATFGETLSDSFSRLSIPDGLFDEILELGWNEEKADVMRDTGSAILIDNSFAERKKIHDRHHIPVFDVIHIDCLYDRRL